MRRRRGLMFLAAMMSLTLVAAACGDDDDDEPGASDTTAAGDTTPTTSGGGQGVLEPTLDDLCQEALDAGIEAPDDFKVSLVTDIGKVDDRTFNQYAYEAMIAAGECFDIETSFIETASEADYAKNLDTTLSGNPSVVITNGFLLATDTLAAAEANPEVQFIGIDQFQEAFPDNYIGVLFREDQGGFLAGVAAGLLTETNVVGVVGGREDVPPVVRFVNAYEAGAKSVNPDVRVIHTYNESFTDTAKGASDAQQMIGEGADVIFGAGGKTGSAGVQEATKQGKWGIGVDQDEYFSTFDGGNAPGSEYLATSAVKRVDLAVFQNIVAALDGSFAGGIFTLEAANDGITYAPSRDAAVPQDVLDALEETRLGLADGSIDTGVDPVTGLPK
ncbi:MAG TPA: BMP family ABC transporter substrate-binding protein [Acidimicrobiia bacterium]|nr:BMP family ABC transporter substrate-binding protein [Acidimicrobiia bacterium]